MTGSQTRTAVLALAIAAVIVVGVGGTVTAATDQFEPNDDFDSAASISLGAYPGLQITGDDTDYFALDLAAGDSVAVSIDFDHDQGDLDLAAYDPNRNEIDDSISLSDGESVGFTAEQSGTYYVEVYPFRDATVDYDLEAIENDRFEPNDEFDEAAAISPGSYQDLHVVGGESDYFVSGFEAGEEVTVDVDFDHGTGDLDLTIYGPNRNQIAESDSVSDGESIVFTTQEAGDHYVEVYGFSGASAPYEFEVREGGGQSQPAMDTPSPTATQTSAPATTAPATTTAPPADGQDSDGDGVPDEHDYAPRDPDVQSSGDVEGGGDVSLPGFGLPAALVAVGLVVALFGMRRR